MTVRVALVGAGWWASRYHLPALTNHPEVELVAVCDPLTDRAADLARAAGARSYDRLADALPLERPDAVVVATPNAHHHEPVMTALRAGCHVLVEKPMATSSAAAVEMIDLARQRGLHLSVGHTLQHAPGATAARDAVHTGIGTLLQVTAEFSSFAAALFERASDDATSGAAASEQHPQSYSAANGGGQAWTQLIHVLGMLCWSTGEEVDRIGAFTATRGAEVDLDAAAAFRLRSGATGVVVGTGSTPAGLPARQHIRYAGTDGVVEHDLLRARVTWWRADGSAVVTEPGQHDPAYRGTAPAEAFIDLILGPGPNLGPARPAAAAVAAVEALLRSAVTGKMADVPPLPGEH